MMEKLIWTEEELPQGSQAWLNWRNGDNGITLGGSEIAALMYLSPYSTPVSLYREKMGLEEKEFSEASMAAMDRGTLLEPYARKHYEKRFGVETFQLCAIHPTKPWMRTSLDGITADKRVILEIKSPSSLKNHSKQTKAGIVPEYRYPQMQWQLAVMREHFENVERVDYISFWAEYETQDDGQPGEFSHIDMAVIQVLPNEEFITELTRRAEIFVRHLEDEIEPPATLFLEDSELELQYPSIKKAYGVPEFR